MLLGAVLLIVGLLMVVVGLVAHTAGDHILWAGVAVGVVGLVALLVSLIERARV